MPNCQPEQTDAVLLKSVVRCHWVCLPGDCIHSIGASLTVSLETCWNKKAIKHMVRQKTLQLSFCEVILEVHSPNSMAYLFICYSVVPLKVDTAIVSSLSTQRHHRNRQTGPLRLIIDCIWQEMKQSQSCKLYHKWKTYLLLRASVQLGVSRKERKRMWVHVCLQMHRLEPSNMC